MKKVEALKRFFSTPDKPVKAEELLDFRKKDAPGFDELAKLAAAALGGELE